MKFLRVLIKRNARLILLLTKKGRRISPRPHIYLVLSSLTFDTSLCVASCFTSSTPLTQYIAKDISAVYNNGLIRLKVNDTNALPLYIYWAMKTSDFLNYINQMNSATSVRPNMKIDYLLNYQLSIPSIEEQTQFTNTVEPLMNAISLNNDEILKLSEFQAIILTTLSSR